MSRWVFGAELEKRPRWMLHTPAQSAAAAPVVGLARGRLGAWRGWELPSWLQHRRNIPQAATCDKSRQSRQLRTTPSALYTQSSSQKHLLSFSKRANRLPPTDSQHCHRSASIMAVEIPPAIKQAGITPFVVRANQLQTPKPVIAYWCMSPRRRSSFLCQVLRWRHRAD